MLGWQPLCVAPLCAWVAISATAPDITTGVEFDGTNDYLLRGGDLTGNANSKVGTVSVWVKFDTLNQNALLNAGTNNFIFGMTATDKVAIQGKNSPVSTVLRLDSDTALSTGTWYHIMASWDLAAASAHLYVNGADDLAAGSTLTNSSIDYTSTEWGVGATNGGSFKHDGCIGELYFAQEYIDLSVEANRNKFATTGSPVSLGADGSTPTGSQPIVYLSGDPTQWGDNFGSGGSFTEQGGSPGLTSCALGSYSTTNTATLSLDAAISAQQTAAASIAAAIQAEQTASASLNAAVRASLSALTSLDGAIQAAGTAAASLNASVQAAGSTQTASVDAAIQAAQSAVVSVSGAIQAAQTATAALSAAVSAGMTATASMSAQISAEGVEFLTTSLDAAIQAATTAATSLDAAISATQTASASTSAAIAAGQTSAASLSALVQQGAMSATAAINAAVSAAQTAAASVSTAIALAYTVSASVNAWISAVNTAASSLSAGVLGTITATTGISVQIGAPFKTSTTRLHTSAAANRVHVLPASNRRH